MSICTTCGNCPDNCGCIPTGLTTPNYCPTDTPACPTPSPCTETFDSKCIFYTGSDIDCVGITSDMTMEEVVQQFGTILSPLFCLECASLFAPANNLTNVALTGTTLSWNNVTGATLYDVYFGTDPVTPTLVASDISNTFFALTTPLLENTSYYWKVVPKNGTSTASGCSILTFTTIAPTCVNPITYFLESVTNALPANAVALDYANEITRRLTAGELLTNCNFCCPDCTDSSRYVLSSAPTYADYYTQVYSSTCVPPCCVEVDASLTALTTPGLETISLATAFAAVPPPTNCCLTGFSECAQEVKTALATSIADVMNLGIVEESTINDYTTLCIIANFLNALPSSFTDTDKSDILSALLEAGVVVDCRTEGTIISSVSSYITYLTAVQPTCPCYNQSLCPPM